MHHPTPFKEITSVVIYGSLSNSSEKIYSLQPHFSHSDKLNRTANSKTVSLDVSKKIASRADFPQTQKDE